MPAIFPPDDAFIACQRLAAAELPPRRLRLLLAHFDHQPIDALAAPPAILAARPIGLTEKQIARLADAARAPIPAPLLKRAEALGVHVVLFSDETYPSNLKPLGDDMPGLLFVRGKLVADDRFSVAIVGSRRITEYGRGQAERFARAFAERNLAVISGGAAGVDTFAHRGALAVGGRTVAVVACGLDLNYPSENRPLFDDIAASGGAIVSEFALQTRPEPWRFPTRNRIIAGIAKGTVLIETPTGSGALITARDAAEFGRDVWVVPGPVETGRSRGGHKLIQDGAALADSPEDVLTGLGINVDAPAPAPRPVQPKPKSLASPTPAPPMPSPVPEIPGLSDAEARLLAQMDLTPRHLDASAQAANLSAPEATVAATLLEMKALIRRQPGNLYVRAL